MPASDRPDMTDVWVEYKRTGDRDLRDRLVLAYTGLVAAVAAQVSKGLPSTIDRDDLRSYGTFGLFDAIERFDLDKGVKFETYAIPRIRGAIIDELRTLDWVPRSVRSKARTVDRAVAALERQLGRSPTEIELARHMQLSLQELRELLGQAEIARIGVIDESSDEDSLALSETLADVRIGLPEDWQDEQELVNVLARSLSRMSERGRTVFALYYFSAFDAEQHEGMTLSQIGDVLGVTESRVCQLHTHAVLELRAELEQLSA